MMGSRDIASTARTAATQIGCTSAEWLTHRVNGERWCALGRHWYRATRGGSCGPCRWKRTKERQRRAA